jgi:hypothetical protein
VILRIVPGRIREEHADAARNGSGASPVGARPSLPGLIRAHAGIRASGEVAGITVWDTTEDARGSLGSRGIGRWAEAVLGGIADLEPPTHFDIEGSWLDRSGPPPTVLRLAIGRFTKPGSDLEMQALLKARMSSIGPEMVEAAAGRRIVGRAVEVLFYSAWITEPAGRPLEGSMWPDIALRYDEFSVVTYRAIA